MGHARRAADVVLLGLALISAPARAADLGRAGLALRYAKAGDLERYRALWADGFRGWPSDRLHPVAKAAVTAWIEKMRRQKIRFTYTLTREGAADFGDVVVVYYRAETLSEFPDGHVEGRGEVSRMTHTWRRFGDAWRIIGGMSADST